MVIVGLTGGMGSGKSTVAGLLAERGAVVIDADRIARQVTEPGGPAYQPLIDHFGPGIVRADATLDRAAIAARVFSDPAALVALNSITHPAITAVITAQVAQVAADAAPGVTAGHRVVVLDLPLLGPDGRARYRLAGVVVIDVPVEVAIRRLSEQRGVGEDDARNRMAAQPSRDERRKLGDIVIDNRGTRQDLARSVDQVWSWILTLPDPT